MKKNKILDNEIKKEVSRQLNEDVYSSSTDYFVDVRVKFHFRDEGVASKQNFMSYIKNTIESQIERIEGQVYDVQSVDITTIAKENDKKKKFKA
jgi:hypothetical protein